MKGPRKTALAGTRRARPVRAAAGGRSASLQVLWQCRHGGCARAREHALAAIRVFLRGAGARAGPKSDAPRRRAAEERRRPPAARSAARRARGARRRRSGARGRRPGKCVWERAGAAGGGGPSLGVAKRFEPHRRVQRARRAAGHCRPAAGGMFGRGPGARGPAYKRLTAASAAPWDLDSSLLATRPPRKRRRRLPKHRSARRRARAHVTGTHVSGTYAMVCVYECVALGWAGEGVLARARVRARRRGSCGRGPEKRAPLGPADEVGTRAARAVECRRIAPRAGGVARAW